MENFNLFETEELTKAQMLTVKGGDGEDDGSPIIPPTKPSDE